MVVEYDCCPCLYLQFGPTVKVQDPRVSNTCTLCSGVILVIICQLRYELPALSQWNYSSIATEQVDIPTSYGMGNFESPSCVSVTIPTQRVHE